MNRCDELSNTGYGDYDEFMQGWKSFHEADYVARSTRSAELDTLQNTDGITMLDRSDLLEEKGIDPNANRVEEVDPIRIEEFDPIWIEEVD